MKNIFSSTYRLSAASQLNEHNRALEYTLSFLSLPSDSTGLKDHGISAKQKALDVSGKQTEILFSIAIYENFQIIYRHFFIAINDIGL